MQIDYCCPLSSRRGREVSPGTGHTDGRKKPLERSIRPRLFHSSHSLSNTGSLRGFALQYSLIMPPHTSSCLFRPLHTSSCHTTSSCTLPLHVVACFFHHPYMVDRLLLKLARSSSPPGGLMHEVVDLQTNMTGGDRKTQSFDDSSVTTSSYARPPMTTSCGLLLRPRFFLAPLSFRKVI
jgi:hypothetical protein